MCISWMCDGEYGTEEQWKDLMKGWREDEVMIVPWNTTLPFGILFRANERYPDHREIGVKAYRIFEKYVNTQHMVFRALVITNAATLGALGAFTYYVFA